MWREKLLILSYVMVFNLIFIHQQHHLSVNAQHDKMMENNKNSNNNDDDRNNNFDDIADFEFDTPNLKNNKNSDSIKLMDYYDDNMKINDFFDDLNDMNKDQINYNDGNENDNEHQHQNAFDVKEKVMRIALSKALTNKLLRQKFVEVIPILRVLSSQQRLALSALISAQINAKPGTELKLDQVKSMFGDNKKLIIPLVFDIANLVKTAAKNSIHYQYDVFSPITSKLPQKLGPSKATPQRWHQQQQQQQQISRRNFDEMSGSFDDVPDDIIDAKQINDELYYTSRKARLLKLLSNHQEKYNSRIKRSLLPLFDKTKSRYSEHSIDSSIADRTFHNRKLNISNFENDNDKMLIEPFKTGETVLDSTGSDENSNVTYYKIEDLALSDINGTELFNDSAIDHNRTLIEELPTPESLISSRYRPKTNNNLGNGQRKPINAQHRLSGSGGGVRPRKPSTNKNNYIGSKCERFTPSMCIHADDYPIEQIMGSIRRHKHAMSALLAEYRDKTIELEYQEYLNNLELNKKRREDSLVTPGGMCSSIVRYARPQKARSATGEWKYIVNTGQHTQTLRLEKCSNPEESCSYLSGNYRSRCLQVYNYHRLLSWDKTRGLHVDIFKVPTCCSCHVDGYRETYPPLTSSHSLTASLNDFTLPSNYKNNQYGTISDEDLDGQEEEDDSEEESIAYQYANGFKRIKSNKYDPSELYQSSSNLKHRLDSSKKIIPTLGSYLSPPITDFDTQLSFKRGPNLTLNKNSIGRTRRPSLSNGYKESDDRADQIISETDIGKEVTVYPSSQKPTVRPKRIKYNINNSVSTSASTKPFTTFSSPTSTTTFPTKATSSTKTLLNTKLTNIKVDGSKRINYNYHPIIDFFDEPSSHQTTSTTSTSSSSSSSQSFGKRGKKDTRLGFGDLNDWRPVIIE